jgi:hypothetical protein
MMIAPPIPQATMRRMLNDNNSGFLAKSGPVDRMRPPIVRNIRRKPIRAAVLSDIFNALASL